MRATRCFKDGPKNCADAELVARTRQAGAVIWGKTNVPFMLSDLQSYNAIYGTTNNPYDVTRVPGGSSGGAAAALATGVTPLEIGSDIGGSLRHPANFCGVTSLKPTWGALPQARSRAAAARSIFGRRSRRRRSDGAQCRRSANCCGACSKARRSKRAGTSKVRASRSGTRTRVGRLARDVREGTDRAGQALEKAGARVEHAKPEIDGAELMAFYLDILTAIIAAGLPRPHARELGSDARPRPGNRHRRRAGCGGCKLSLARDRELSRDRGGECQTARAQGQARALLRALRRHRDADFAGDRVPAQQEPTFQDRMLDLDGKPTPYPNMLNWISLATALHAPALAVQAGQTAKGLPVGVQIVGPWNGEDRLFDFAAAVEEGLGGFKAPPGL